MPAATQTGATIGGHVKARLEVTFTEGTQVTLGEKAELTLGTFVFNPAAGSGRIKFGVVGASRFLSGQASKLASSDVSVTTPVAAVAAAARVGGLVTLLFAIETKCRVFEELSPRGS
jgi:hypothetical protein